MVFVTLHLSFSVIIAEFWALTYILDLCSPCSSNQAHTCFYLGGDPAAGSPTATLLRLFPPHET